MSKQMKRKIKDSVFGTLFSIPEYALDMYRSLHPEDTEATENDIAVITIENILVTGMFNDLGLQVKNKVMILAEAQSTFTRKLAIRLFLYLAESLGNYIKDMETDLYSESNVIGYLNKKTDSQGKVIRCNPFYKLPTPELYVIYTGDQTDIPDEIDFSELYEPMSDGTKPVSLKVRIIKTSDKNDSIGQYIRFCKAANQMRRQHADDMKLAVQKLVEYCIENGILSEFVQEHRDEVYDMMDVLFNQDYVTEIHDKNLIWAGYDKGKNEERNAWIKILSDSGAPKDLIDRSLKMIQEQDKSESITNE